MPVTIQVPETGAATPGCISAKGAREFNTMNKYKEARNKGGRYLLKQLHVDGSIGDKTVGDYYK